MQKVKHDGVVLNATHFGQKSEDEAVKAMIADHITDDEAWAKEAYAKCVAALSPETAPAAPSKPRQTKPRVEKGS